MKVHAELLLLLLFTRSTYSCVFCFVDPLDLGLDDDDQHDYDSVASDEDTDSELTAQNNNTQRSNRAKVNHCCPQPFCYQWPVS